MPNAQYLTPKTMKPIEKIKKTLPLLLILLLAVQLHSQDRIYYAVEIDNILCGYATTDTGSVDYKGKMMKEVNDSVHLLMKVLGQDMEATIATRYIFDPATNMLLLNNTHSIYSDGNILSSATEVFSGFALFTNSSTGITDTFSIDGDVIFENPVSSPYLIDDFVKGKAEKKTYRIFDYMRGGITDQEFTLKGEDSLEINGQLFNTLIFDVFNHKYGMSTRMWIDISTGETLQFDVLNRHIYRTDASVIKLINTVDMDNSIFGRVDKNIHNFMDLTYLKVKADIQSAGEKINVESLNFPGQIFEGTVEDNHIVGVFVIEPRHYDGKSAPPFPPDFSGDATLKNYIEPEMLIESDHPDIVAMAKSITDGSADSWEAVIRLSEWVGKEISGAVPGGTSAIGTLNSRQGECGSHSRLLAAFNRAVGIPSRLAIGCMYSTWYGGSFGQHAWTEVYMGDEVGWVPIDATILEYDYVDAGHIKLGEMATFLPNSMEILEYNTSDGMTNDKSISAEYLSITGQYTKPKDRNVLDVQYIDGGISVDIMGKIMLALQDPDEQGRMYAKLTENVYFMFPKDSMVIVEKAFAMKKLDEGTNIPDGTPGEYRNMMGKYIIFQLQKEFEVSWREDQLIMFVPDVEEARELVKTKDEGQWQDPVDKKEYKFRTNPDGSISGMNIFVTSILLKGATAAWIVDKAIEEEGLESGIKKFNEGWTNRAFDPEKTESDMNKLGYKYINQERLEDALAIFKLNVETFPGSWNAYGSYAEALLKSGDSEKAVVNFKKSLELNPNNERAREMLEEINNPKK